MTTLCRICGGAFDLQISATERMVGVGGEFRYDRCGSCGCVQLRDVPRDLSPYYAGGYYAFATQPTPSATRRTYRHVRDALLFGQARTLGALVAPILPPPRRAEREWFAVTGTGRSSRVLDVGCGGGLLVGRLASAGFRHVLGVDPFIQRDVHHRGRLVVKRGTLDDVSGPFDLIMFHHSLEHIDAQRATMQRVRDVLAPDGWCLIRIPTVSSDAWEEYQDRWVQLDAPRHLFLHSRQSLALLARQSGLRVVRVIDDSSAFQFEGSELYRQDRPLSDLHGWPFSRRQRRQFARKARQLNANHRGDQAAFYLRSAAPDD